MPEPIVLEFAVGVKTLMIGGTTCNTATRVVRTAVTPITNF